MVILIPAFWLVKRATDSTPVAALTSTIVVSDVVNDTGDPSFDSAFRQSIGSELQRNPSVNVLQEDRVSETLSQMRRPSGTRLTREIAREICVRTGSAAFVESSLSKVGRQ